MTRRRKWSIAGIVLTLVAALALALEGELRIVLANQRPDAEGAALAQHLGIQGKETVAEIGAGKGRLTVALARRLPRGRMYSTELGRANVDELRRTVSENGLRNVEVREGELAGTNLPDECCEAIFMRTVYHHFTDPPAMIAALRLALKPGGRLAIVEFEPRGLWRFLAAPHDVPDRGGHGVSKQMLLHEVTAAKQFRHEETVDDWAGPLYLMMFRRN